MRFVKGMRWERMVGRVWARRLAAGSVAALLGATLAGLAPRASVSWAKGHVTPAAGASATAHARRRAERDAIAAQLARRAAVTNYGKLPLHFEANRGQTDPQVDFLARGRSYTLFLTRNQAILALKQTAAGAAGAARPAGTSVRRRLSSSGRTAEVFRMRLVGANPAAVASGVEEQPGKTNYFLGKDRRAWRSNIPNYSGVEYSSVYPGVNLVYYGSRQQLEYDFRLAPGADPSAVVLQFEADAPSALPGRRDSVSLKLAGNGDLVMATSAGVARFHKPVAYQLGASGQRRNVSVNYVLGARSPKDPVRGDQVAFSLGSYDRTLPLVIDPVLTYSTFLGGSGIDSGYAIAVDASGNAYVAGATSSTDFPGVTSGACPTCGMNQGGDSDIFVAKLNPAGSALVYSTYIGGSGTDLAAGIALDTSGDAYITGQTDSNNYPIAPNPGAYQTLCGGSSCASQVYDAFVTKVSSDGASLMYSSYLGGSSADQGYGIAVDSSGNAYIAGLTASGGSGPFPVTSGAYQTTFGGGSQDAFITKLNPGGKGQADLLYSTYLGGSGSEQAEGIALDASDNVFVAGQTVSTNFPATTGAYDTTCGSCTTDTSDAFMSKLTLAGKGSSDLLYSTYLGGSSADEAKSIAVDSAGNAYVTGETDSTDFPTAGPFQAALGGGTDAFVAKLNPAGEGPADLVYSTYLGGTDEDQGNTIVVDALGDAYVAGLTASADFPVTANALQGTCGTDGTCNGGLNDAFVTLLAPDGSGQMYSTYLGGDNDDEAFAIAVDAAGDVFVTGSTVSPGSFTVGQGFPVTMGAFQTMCGTDGNCDNAMSDAFVAELNLGPTAEVSPTSLDFGDVAAGSSSAPQTVTLTNNGIGTLSIANIAITGGQVGEFSEIHTCGPTLAPNANCTIIVTFTPSGIGSQSSELSITDNASDSPQNVPLSGNGISPGVIQLAPPTLDFGNQLVGTTSAAQPVTMKNNGTATITISSIKTTGNFAQTNNCGTSLGAGASCTINVTFSPTTTGAQAGALTVTDNDTPDQQTVSLTGSGTQAQVTLSPASLTFPIQAVGTTSAPMTVGLTNTGSGVLTITSIAIGGTNSGDFTETNNCGTSVTTSNSCTITVTFTPAASGTRTATLMVTDNAPGSPQTVSLSGTGSTGPGATLSPTTLAFGNQAVGTASAAMAVTLSNNGTQDLTITSITLSGANAGDFAQTNTCGAKVAAGTSCSINVTFTPAASGSRSATLNVNDNASNSPQTAALSGTGAAPAVSFSPTSLSFGSVNLGSSSSAQMVTLNNTGNADLSISRISVGGTDPGDFTQTNTCGATVSAGSSCTITVTFKPAAAGSRTGTISVSDNAAGSPQTAGLSGTGTGAQVMLSPGAIAFGGENVGSSSTPSTATLTNTGNASLTITSISIGGTNSGDFVQTNTCGTSVPAGKACTISVTFTPAKGGSRSASLSVSDDAIGSPQSIPVTGSGEDFSAAASPGSVSVAPGVSANYTFTLNPVGGFNEAVQVTCSGAPSGSKCTASPASPTLNGSTATKVAVTVTTTAPSVAPPLRRIAPPSLPWAMPHGTPALWLAFLGLAGAISLFRRRRAWAMLGLAALSVVLWASCGGSTVIGGGGGPKSGGTPAGTYTLTLTAAGGNQTHSTTVTLIVQ